MGDGRKEAFVTGGTGFVGSHLVEALLEKGYHVKCLVRTDLKWLDGLDVEIVRGSLSSSDTLRKSLEDITHVFHVAGLTRSQKESELYEANVVGTINLLKQVGNHAKKIERVLVTSSLAAVGFSERIVATEASPLRPISAYGRSKAKMETAVAALLKDRSWSHLPVTIVRPPAVYGPREKDIYVFIKTLSKGIAPIVGTGTEPELSLVFVSDLVAGMIGAAEHPDAMGETYFIGSEDQYSWQEIKAGVMTALDRKRALTVPVPRSLVTAVGSVVELGGRIIGKFPALNEEKAIEILKACKMCSVAKATNDFGYSQKTTLDDGLRQTVNWYRDNNWL